jgi:predicted DNA-binding transcriptional regulator AlpA
VSKTAKPEIKEALRLFDELPASAHVKQPIVQALFACSHSSIWRYVASGKLPRPKKFGHSSVWNVGELRATIAAAMEITLIPDLVNEPLRVLQIGFEPED